MSTYRTKNGDTWDKIAFELLGSEYLLPFLLQANQQYRQYVQFPAGIELTIPTVTATTEKRPDWLQEPISYEEESIQPWLTEDSSN